MRKTLLAMTAVLLAATTVNAQPYKGDWMLGFNIFPQTFKAGKFLSNNLLLSVGMNAGFSQGVGINQTYAHMGLSPSLRYYFCAKDGLSANKFNFYADVNFDVSARLMYNDIDKLTIARNSLGPGIGPGLQYMLTDRVSAEGMMRFNYRGIGEPGFDQVATTYEIGMQVYLKGRKKRNSDVSEMRSSEL